MMRNDGSETKTRRMTLIAKEIAKHFPGSVDLDKMLLWIRVHVGLTPKKAEEYLNDVIDSHGWISKDGLITACEDEKNDESEKRKAK
jgi:hypothetical protein